MTDIENAELSLWISKEFMQILHGRAMKNDVNKMPPVDVANAWMLLDLLEGAIADRKNELRGILMGLAERSTEITDKGSTIIELAGARIERQLRESKEPNREKMLELTQSRGIPVNNLFDEVRSLIFNPTKAQFLIDTGKISSEEIESHKTTTPALTVKKPKSLVDLFDAAQSEEMKKKERMR